MTLALALTACGGGANSGSPGPTPPIPEAVLFVLPPPASMAVNASVTLSAAATFAGSITTGDTAVTWTVRCAGSSTCGSFGANADGGAVTYTAPPAIPAGGSVTVTATSVADPAKADSATITIVAPIPIAVSFTIPPSASVQAGRTLTLEASIVNDVSADPKVAWTVACGAAACGSFDPTSTASTAATTYTAPSVVPPGGGVTVTATSLTDATQSVSATVIITAATPTLANGTYVFQMSGSPGYGASVVTGVFAASDGVITGGEQDSIAYTTDVNNNPIGNPDFEPITGGTYGTSPDGNLAVSIQLGPNATEVLNGTLGPGAQGFVAQLNGANLAGTLELQSSIAAPSGGFALALQGGDLTGSTARLAGILNLDGPGTLSGSGSVLDVIDGEPSQTGTFSLGLGSISAPDAFGRVTIDLEPAADSTLPALYLAGYVVDAGHLRLVETGDNNDNVNFQGVLGGVALGQGGSTGQFDAASVSGSSFVWGAQGEDAAGALQLAGTLGFGSAGAATGMLDWNDLTAKAVQSPLVFTGGYSVDATGRVSVDRITDGGTFEYSLHVYLAADGRALLLSNDSADAFSGEAYLRQSAAFSGASLSGAHGLNATQFTRDPDSGALVPGPLVGAVAATPGAGLGAASDALSGFADRGDGGNDFELKGGAAPAGDGIFAGSLTGLQPDAPTTVGSIELFLVDATQAVFIETDPAHLTLGHLQLVP